MKRVDLLEKLSSWVDDETFTVTSLSSNTAIWSNIGKGPSFSGLNMGLCLGFAMGVALAFPSRKVIALESDGSQMVDTSAMITMADANLSNLIVLVMDNESYARMGKTATSRETDLAKMAEGAGVKVTGTIRTEEEFEQTVKQALVSPGPSFFVVKIEAETERIRGNARRAYGRAMRERFLEAVQAHPDYKQWTRFEAAAAAR